MYMCILTNVYVYVVACTLSWNISFHDVMMFAQMPLLCRVRLFIKSHVCDDTVLANPDARIEVSL